MVIGRTFAWGHLPKAGGDATLALFRLVPELVLEADESDTNEKHASFADRREQIAGKKLLLNLRRLPSWLLSRAHHQATRGLFPDYVPLPMESPQQMAESTAGDALLRHFLNESEFSVDHWLRMERLQDDFLSFIGDLAIVTQPLRQLVYEVGRINALRYDHEPRHWFTPKQIDLMYANNPLWTALESELYPT